MHDTPFTGFPESGTQFLRELRDNNTREWFEAHKQAFVDHVQQPAVALVRALGQRLEAAYPPISYDARPNNGSLTRIHRDTRFSPDKTPYKTNVAMMFVAPGRKRMASPGFGLQITPEQVELVAGQFGFTKAQLDAYREAVVSDKHGPGLTEAWMQVQAANPAYALSDPELKRVPRDFDAQHTRADWLKHKGLAVYSPPISLDVAHSAAFVDAVMTHFHQMAPIQQWLFGVLDEITA